MKTTVELQAQFSYAKWPMFFVGILILICIGILIFPTVKRLLMKKKVKEQKPVVIKQKSASDLAGIKGKYLLELSQLEGQLKSGTVSTRDAYMRMSSCIRSFVYDATGIEVTNYTLQEIKRLGMPILEELISEYYTPEFAANSVGDSIESLQKTKRAIERWN